MARPPGIKETRPRKKRRIDPEKARRAATIAALARTTPDYHIGKLETAALTGEQKRRLAALVLGGEVAA
jgi:hypothetical protein